MDNDTKTHKELLDACIDCHLKHTGQKPSSSTDEPKDKANSATVYKPIPLEKATQQK